MQPLLKDSNMLVSSLKVFLNLCHKQYYNIIITKQELIQKQDKEYYGLL